MKHAVRLAVIVLFVSSALYAQEKDIRHLEIKEPEGSLKSKYTLLVNLEHINGIISQTNPGDRRLNIDLATTDDLVIARLGHVDKKLIKWAHKVVLDHYLQVKFHKNYYKAITSKLQEKAVQTGFQLLLTDPGMETVIYSTNITFAEFADIVAELKYPVRVNPGQDLSAEITVILENRGAGSASQVDLKIVLSSDDRVDIQDAPEESGFAEDQPLPGGEWLIESMKPGERKNVVLEKPLVIPPDTPPGKYFLCAVADATNKIKELSETNNLFAGFVMVVAPMPKEIVLRLTDNELYFQPSTYGLRILSHGIVISDGKDWRKCRMKAYLYQVMHVGWKDIHWEINTWDRGIWEITGAEFCKTGGKARDLRSSVLVSGGSKTALPASFTVQLPEIQIRYDTENGRLSAECANSPIMYTPLWKVCRVEAHRYHIRFGLWKNFFLEVNTLDKTVHRISGGTFCRDGGEKTALDIAVEATY